MFEGRHWPSGAPAHPDKPPMTREEVEGLYEVCPRCEKYRDLVDPEFCSDPFHSTTPPI